MKLNSLADLQKLLPASHDAQLPHPQKIHDGKGRTVSVTLDTEGRKGKSVTIVSGLRHNPAAMEDLARLLKQHCGAGGTVKEGNIEIQGDQRGKVKEKLKGIGYMVRN